MKEDADAHGNETARAINSIADLPTPIPDGQGGQVAPTPPADEIEGGNAPPPASSTTDDPTAVQQAEEEKHTNGEEAAMDVDGQAMELGEQVEARRAFPSVSPDRPEADVLPPQAIRQTPSKSTPLETGKGGLGKAAWKLLPEIARLAREMVKNGEEKVAVAQGAYNSVSPYSQLSLSTELILGRLTDISVRSTLRFLHRRRPSYSV